MFNSNKKVSYFRVFDRRFLYIRKKSFQYSIDKWKEKHASLCVQKQCIHYHNNSCVILNINSIFFCVLRCYKGREDRRKIHNTMNSSAVISIHVSTCNTLNPWNIKKKFNKGYFFSHRFHLWIIQTVILW